MIYWDLFCSFLMIGAVSFGGGYGMLSLIRETVLNRGWLAEEEFINFIAVSESTPGPLAVNMATFIGASQGGFWGAAVATVGVVLPAFILILLIAAVMKNLLRYAGVRAFLSGLRPCVAAMVLATALLMGLKLLLGLAQWGDPLAPDWRAWLIIAILGIGQFILRRRGRALSPVGLILLSAGLGICLY